jgi:hypothetical protein
MSSTIPTPKRDPTKACILEAGRFILVAIITAATEESCDANPLELLM